MTTFDIPFIPDNELQALLITDNLSLDNLAGWYISAHRWAKNHGFISGLPTFLWSNAKAGSTEALYSWKTICLGKRYGSLIEIAEKDLKVLLKDTTYGLDTLNGRHTAAHKWALSQGFSGGFPTHLKAKAKGKTSFLTLCFSEGVIDVQDVPEDQLRRFMYPFFKFESPNGRQAGAHLWAETKGYLSGFPTYIDSCIEGQKKFGTACFRTI